MTKGIMLLKRLRSATNQMLSGDMRPGPEWSTRDYARLWNVGHSILHSLVSADNAARAQWFAVEEERAAREPNYITPGVERHPEDPEGRRYAPYPTYGNERWTSVFDQPGDRLETLTASLDDVIRDIAADVIPEAPAEIPVHELPAVKAILEARPTAVNLASPEAYRAFKNYKKQESYRLMAEEMDRRNPEQAIARKEQAKELYGGFKKTAATTRAGQEILRHYIDEANQDRDPDAPPPAETELYGYWDGRRPGDPDENPFARATKAPVDYKALKARIKAAVAMPEPQAEQAATDLDALDVLLRTERHKMKTDPKYTELPKALKSNLNLFPTTNTGWNYPIPRPKTRTEIR